MKYYDREFRVLLTGLLTGYRKMIEQSLAVSKDPNYHLFANDTKKQIDEALKVVKPNVYNSVTEGKVKKLEANTEVYLQKMEKEYQDKIAELENNFDNRTKAKLEILKKQQEDNIRNELSEQWEQEKRTMVSVELLPQLLQEFFYEKGIVQSVSKTESQTNKTEDSGSDDLGSGELETLD